MGTVAAGDAVSSVVAELTASLTAQLDGAARNDEDAVHQARVVVRRLRSVLQVYRPVLKKRAARELRGRLKDLGTHLGEVRDLEVMALAAAEKLGPEVRATVREALVADYAADYRRAHHALQRVVRSHEVVRLQVELARFAKRPRTKGRAGKSASRVLPALVETAIGAVETAAQAEWDALGEEAREEAFHSTRKAGRRLRYVAESALGFVPGPEGTWLTAIAKAGESIQDLLGEHRDEVIFAKRLQERARESDETNDREDAREYRSLASAARERGEAVLITVTSAMEQLEALRLNRAGSPAIS